MINTFNTKKVNDQQGIIEERTMHPKDSFICNAWGEKLFDVINKNNVPNILILLLDYRIFNAIFLINISNYICILFSSIFKSKTIAFWSNVINLFINTLFFIWFTTVSIKMLNFIYIYKSIKKMVYIFLADYFLVLITIACIYFTVCSWQCMIIMPLLLICQLNYACNSIMNRIITKIPEENNYGLNAHNMIIRTVLLITLIYEIQILIFILLFMLFFVNMYKKSEGNLIVYINAGLFYIIYINAFFLLRLENEWKDIACVCFIICSFLIAMFTFSGLTTSKLKVYPLGECKF